jgi:hypothetical protein
LAEIGDMLSPELKAELAEIHEASTQDPSWFVAKDRELKLDEALTPEEAVREMARAWERRKSRMRVDEARRTQNQIRHERLLKRHREYKPTVDPDRGE